jgi:hypothetical protein
MTAPAQAAVPSTADMQQVCDTLDVDGAGTEYQVILTVGNVDLGAPTNDESTLRDDESTRVGDPSSIQTPAGTRSFYSAAGRHGGSVNLFATVGWSAKRYAGSLVDQLVDRFETDTYNFSCQVQHWEVVGSHTEGVPAVPPEGYYTNPQDNSRGDCQGISPENPHWGHDIGACIWTETAPGQPATTIEVDDYGWADQGSAEPESLTNGPYYVDTITENFAVSEPSVPFIETANAPYFQGDVVVCINPGSKGGTWKVQNGWTNTAQCTTSYFLTAPYISGANVFSSNSLPL